MNPIEKALKETFHCLARDETVKIVDCLDGFLWANTLITQKNSVCNRCMQGVKVRLDFAPTGSKDPAWLKEWEDNEQEETDMNSADRAQHLWNTRVNVVRNFLETLTTTKHLEMTADELMNMLGPDVIAEHFAGDSPVIFGRVLMRLVDADPRFRRIKGAGHQFSTFVWDPMAKEGTEPVALTPKLKPKNASKPKAVAPETIPEETVKDLVDPSNLAMTTKAYCPPKEDPILATHSRKIRAIALVDGFLARFANEAMSTNLLLEIRDTLKDAM